MKLLLADDHLMFLDALRGGLESRGHDIVGSSERLEDLAALVELHRPDLCILDVDFAGRSVLDTASAIRGRWPEIAMLLLSGSAGAEVWRAYEQGVVDGVVNKLCDLDMLDRAITRVAAGGRVVERFERPRATKPTPPGQALSRQERNVLGLLMRGASTEQMAATLNVSPNTVRSHIQRILVKVGVNSRAKAACAVHALEDGRAAHDGKPRWT